MPDDHMIGTEGFLGRGTMSDSASSAGAPPVADPRPRIAHMHHEICTALTVLRSNVELVRIELRGDVPTDRQVLVQRHLVEVDLAVDRLRRLAVEMRSWQLDGAGDP